MNGLLENITALIAGVPDKYGWMAAIAAVLTWKSNVTLGGVGGFLKGVWAKVPSMPSSTPADPAATRTDLESRHAALVQELRSLAILRDPQSRNATLKLSDDIELSFTAALNALGGVK
jgi:hypothetical protein